MTRSGWEGKKGLAYPPNIQPGLEPWMERVRVTLEYLLDSSVKAARVVTVTLDVDTAGQVMAQMTPNENTKWIEYAWSTTAYPTIAEIQASGNEVRTWVDYYTEKGLGTTYSTPVLTTLTLGQTLYFGVIAYQYELDDQSAPSGTPSVPVYAEITFGVDEDTIPEIAEAFLTPDFKTWDVIYRYTGDDDTNSIRYAVSLDTDWASNALAKTAAEAGTPVDGRVNREVVYSSLQEDHTIYVAVVAYDGANGTGNVGTEVYRYELRRGLGGGVGSCPNLAPPNAGQVVGIQQARPSTVVTYPWNPVTSIAGTGISRDGDDVVSMCVDLRVGPTDTSGDVSACDNKLMRTHSGLLYRPLQTQEIIDQLTYGGYAAEVWKNGRHVWEFDITEPGIVRHVLNEATYDSSGGSWYRIDPDTGLIIPTVPLTDIVYEARYKLYLQTELQYEGVESTLVGGTGVVNLNDSLDYRNWTTEYYEGEYYFMNCPIFGVVDGLDAEDGYVYWCGTGTGLYSATSSGSINTMSSGYLGSQLDSNLWHGRPSRFFIDTTPGETPRCVAWQLDYNPGLGGGEPLYSESVSGGPWYGVIGLENDVRSGWSNRNYHPWKYLHDSVGRAWFWDPMVMEDQKVYFSGITEGYYVKLTSTGAYDVDPSEAYSVEAADASGNCEVWLNWRSIDTSRYSISTTAPEFSAVCPLTRFEIWDGEPWDPGSSVTYSCTVPVGFYGGDWWSYDSTGTQTPGETLPITGKAVLEFLDGTGEPLITDWTTTPYERSVETTTVNSTLWTRVGIQNVPVPPGTSAFRFSLVKEGSPEGWVQAKNLQFNQGAECCTYSDPESLQGSVTAPSSGGSGTGTSGTVIAAGDLVSDSVSGTTDYHIRQMWSKDDGEYVTAAQIYDSIQEHREGASNILQLGLAERQTAGGTGSESGTAYPRITLADHGIEPGQKISIRFQAKREA